MQNLRPLLTRALRNPVAAALVEHLESGFALKGAEVIQGQRGLTRFVRPCRAPRYSDDICLSQALEVSPKRIQWAFKLIGHSFKSWSAWMEHKALCESREQDPFQGMPYVAVYHCLARHNIYLRSESNLRSLIEAVLQQPDQVPQKPRPEGRPAGIPASALVSGTKQKLLYGVTKTRAESAQVDSGVNVTPYRPVNVTPYTSKCHALYGQESQELALEASQEQVFVTPYSPVFVTPLVNNKTNTSLYERGNYYSMSNTRNLKENSNSSFFGSLVTGSSRAAQKLENSDPTGYTASPVPMPDQKITTEPTSPACVETFLDSLSQCWDKSEQLTRFSIKLSKMLQPARAQIQSAGLDFAGQMEPERAQMLQEATVHCMAAMAQCCNETMALAMGGFSRKRRLDYIQAIQAHFSTPVLDKWCGVGGLEASPEGLAKRVAILALVESYWERYILARYKRAAEVAPPVVTQIATHLGPLMEFYTRERAREKREARALKRLHEKALGTGYPFDGASAVEAAVPQVLTRAIQEPEILCRAQGDLKIPAAPEILEVPTPLMPEADNAIEAESADTTVADVPCSEGDPFGLLGLAREWRIDLFDEQILGEYKPATLPDNAPASERAWEEWVARQWSLRQQGATQPGEIERDGKIVSIWES